MQDFIIVSPRYAHNSNGIKTLHKICHTINSVGGKAHMAFIDSGDPNCQTVSLRDASWTNPEWNTPPLQESERHLFETAYVIYPEVILGNPFNAPRVVRYFGNREGYCNGKPINIGPNDFLLAHSRATRPNAQSILFSSFIPDTFHDNGAKPAGERTLDATYIGKGYLYGPVAIIDNTVMIGRDWPNQQNQLAVMLRSVRVFYTWDSWTQTNVEAVLCGAIPFFLRYEPWTEADIDGSELGPLPRLDRNHQNFDATKFAGERLALINRIAELRATWDQRVHDFMKAAEGHFIARGVDKF